jgi:translation initiation factor 2 subunit 1
MSVLRKSKWPERGELLLATVKKVTDYGAYVTLEEYGNKEGLLHRSEISSSWVRNIRNHVREGQKLVLKALRVDPRKGHIDLSRKRVTKRERIDKIYVFKHERKAETFLRIVAESINKPTKEFFNEVVPPLEETYGDLYTALEEASRIGSEALTKAGIPTDIAQTLADLASEKIRPPQVKIKGVLSLTNRRPNGVEIIRNALQEAQNTSAPDSVKIHISTIAPPKYRLKVEADNYKQAETVIQKAAEAAITLTTKSGGTGNFKREK